MINNTLLLKLKEVMKSPYNTFLSDSILSFSAPEPLANYLNTFCLRNLNAAVTDCFFASFSIGGSFGLKLETGMEIFLKVNKPSTEENDMNMFSLSSFKAISKVQSCLYEENFPCPKVIIPPIEYNGLIVTVNEFADIGIQIDAHKPEIRKLIAECLAELMNKTDKFKELPGLPYRDFFRSDSLYPVPHNALFDFEASSKGAEWIDEIAARAKKIILSIPSNIALGHTDWSLKHFRFKDNKIVMIYDWDSLYVQDEFYTLAIAAGSFTTTWDIPVKITPSQEESYNFVKEYEYAGGKKFSKKELKKISAYLTYFLCYTARCEFVNNGNDVKYDGSFRQALKEMQGDNYLNI